MKSTTSHGELGVQKIGAGDGNASQGNTLSVLRTRSKRPKRPGAERCSRVDGDCGSGGAGRNERITSGTGRIRVETDDVQGGRADCVEDVAVVRGAEQVRRNVGNHNDGRVKGWSRGGVMDAKCGVATSSFSG